VNAGSPQANAGAQRSPNNPVQRTLTDAASAISASGRRVLDSSAKIVSRRNKNQATSPTAQQDDAFAAMAMQLGNASGAPLDGSHNVSFGEDVAGEGHIVDSAAKSAASS